MQRFRMFVIPSLWVSWMILLSDTWGRHFLSAAQTQDAVCEADGTCTTDDATRTTNEDGIECTDLHGNCESWAQKGECNANPRYMHVNCRRSCELCPDQTKDRQELTAQDLGSGVDFGVAQNLFSKPFNVGESQTRERIEESRQYLQTVQLHPPELKDLCRNEHELCTVWAIAGECDANPKYMKKSCAAACLSCDYLSFERRCPFDPNTPNAWGPGDLDAMFTKLTSEPILSQYDVQILSSPATTNGPWVITMDNVISDEEAERLIALGADEGYQRSSDVGKFLPDGTHESNVNEGRTSTNAWCQHACYRDEKALAVAYRLSNLTGIPETNSEYLQLLRYEVGQFYQVHHDFIQYNEERQPGPRILTVFLYLNNVKAGGGTNFDKLKLTVEPKVGRALLWPSVLDSDPRAKDGRTTHQALPVEEGIKYGANAWFHLRDFKTPNRDNCH